MITTSDAECPKCKLVVPHTVLKADGPRILIVKCDTCGHEHTYGATTIKETARVGGEVDANCGKCDMNLGHTILAMDGLKIARVKCNTCGSDHLFKGQQPRVLAQSFAAPKKTAAQKRAATKGGGKAGAGAQGWEEQLKAKSAAGTHKYNIKQHFKLDEVIDHPTFGMGFITAVREDKIDVAFKAFEKTLQHAKGPAPVVPPPPPKHGGRFGGKPWHQRGPQAPQPPQAAAAKAPAAADATPASPAPAATSTPSNDNDTHG